jgi:hypothetical protein
VPVTSMMVWRWLDRAAVAFDRARFVGAIIASNVQQVLR